MYSTDSEDSDSISLSTKWCLLSNCSNRQYSAHPINQRRQDLGEYHHLFKETETPPEQLPVHYVKRAVEWREATWSGEPII